MLSRRDALKRMGAIAAGAAAGTAAACSGESEAGAAEAGAAAGTAAAASMASPIGPIGVQLYTVRAEMTNGVESTLERVAAIGYRRFLSPQRAALEKLAALPGDWLADDDRLHLAAAADRAARMAEEVEAIRERAALMHEALTDLRAEQLDQRSLVIAIVAMVFLPLTFITGLYGMNVKGLPYADQPWAFDAVMGICAAVAAGVTIYFLRRHWFRG